MNLKFFGINKNNDYRFKMVEISAEQRARHFQTINWNAIIIGTGISGSTLGYALAKEGQRVLFIERGLSHLDGNSNLIRGQFPEEQFNDLTRLTPNQTELLSRGLRCTERVSDISMRDRPVEFTPLLGQGTGGSSSLYGAAMERFFPEDFQAKKYFNQFPNTSMVDWPLSYKDFSTYYEQAESLYFVHGSPDPLREKFQSKNLLTATLSPVGKKLFRQWQEKGLHPYRLPVAHKPHDASTCPGCQGTLCAAGDKMGGAEACLRLAVENFGAQLLPSCQVTQLIAEANHLTRINCRLSNKLFTFSGEKIFLAAGALFSPALLLKSKSPAWPQGLANSSGQVGKNLSRHFMDLFLVSLPPLKDGGYFEKEIALNDFYFWKDLKLGTVQSLGNPPAFNSAVYEMYNERPYHPGLFHNLYLNLLRRVGRPIYNQIMRNKLCLASIMDDASYEENRVDVDETTGRVQIHYSLRPEAQDRLKIFRRLIVDSLGPYSVQAHFQGENNQRLAHASGTCRMGADPRTSVVNLNNRCHDLDNLYILDASFFPSGAGMNPALTLAANALRVANVILRKA